MKNFQLGLVLLTVLTSPAARAAVVDGFSCDLSLKDKGGKILLQSSMELAAARRPLNESPRPGVLLTSANAEGNVKGALEKFSLSASFQLSYQHAVELDASSKPVQAAQSLCFAIGYEVCGPSSHGSATGAAPVMDCSWSSISCVSTADDPFKLRYPWAKTNLSHGGIPSFDPESLMPASIDIENKGKLTIQCRFKSTIE